MKSGVLSQDEKHVALFTKMRIDTASPEEIKDFRTLHEVKSPRVLKMVEDKFFWVREVEIKPPEKAIIYYNLICSKCGEGFIESLGRVRNGKVVCIPYFEAKDK